MSCKDDGNVVGLFLHRDKDSYLGTLKMNGMTKLPNGKKRTRSPTTTALYVAYSHRGSMLLIHQVYSLWTEVPCQKDREATVYQGPVAERGVEQAERQECASSSSPGILW